MHPSGRIQALVFDLDDTLYPEEQYQASGRRAVAQLLADEFNLAADSVEKQLAELHITNPGRVFDVWLEARGARTDVLVNELVSHFRAHVPDIALHEDADAALADLAGRYDLALLTDGYLEAQRNKVTVLGLYDRLQAIQLTDEIGRHAWKPSPVGYERLLSILSTSADSTAYIGDNPAKDFVGARRLGMKTIRVRRTGALHAALEPADAEHAADIEVPDLEDLRTVIETL